MTDLYKIELKRIWEYLKKEDASFWLINIYLFFEYVRPQTIYPVIDVLPYAQIVLIFTFIALFTKEKSFAVKNIENRLILGYFFVIILSSIFALSPKVSFEKVPDFLAWVLIYFLIVNIVNTERRFLVFILAFLLYNFKMSQFAFRGWASIGFGYGKEGTGGGPGWFQNSGEFGIEMCIFFPLAVYFIIALKEYWPKWKTFLFLLFPFTALTGIISCSSRAVLIGGAAVLVWILLKSKHKVKGLICFVIIVFLFFQFIPEEQMARFDRTGTDRTSTARIERWKKGLEMTRMYPYLGVGFENWAIADKRFFGDGGAKCHNIFIECVSQLGYLGLSLFILMIFFVLINNFRTRSITNKMSKDNKFIYYMAHGLDAALIGYLLSGFFVTVLYYPYFWINMAMTSALNNIANTKRNNVMEQRHGNR